MVVQNFTTDEDIYHHILGNGDESNKDNVLGEVGIQRLADMTMIIQEC